MEVTVKDKKTIKREILDQFRTIDAENIDQLPPQWLERVYLKQLTTDEKKLFKKAMQELIAMGIVENVEGPSLNVKLTRKGERLIYSGALPKPGKEDGPERPIFHFTGPET